MIIAALQVINKLGRAQFFLEILFLEDISMEVILEMPFVNFSNANI